MKRSPTARVFFVLTSIATILTFGVVGDAQSQGIASMQGGDSSAIYSGVYVSTSEESIFSPCAVTGIGSGWSARFRNDTDAAFLRYQYGISGMPALTHFIRVRGRVSAPGHYGLGFQTREIVVDSVLEIKETAQACPSYEDLPQPWERIRTAGIVIGRVSVSDDKTMVASLDPRGVVSVWNTGRGELAKQFPSDDNGDFASATRPLVFSHDGKLLAAGGADGVVRVWNPISGQRLWTFAATDTLESTLNGQRMVASSERLDFNRSGTLLANTVSGKIAIWSTVSGLRIGTFKEGSRSPRFLFIGDSSFIASGDSGLMKIYPRLGAAPIWRIKTPLRYFGVMDRSPDGRWLLLKDWADTAHLWSLSDGLPAHVIAIPHWFGTGAIAFSPDGNTIATSGGSNGLYLWDTKTGQPLRSFQKYRGSVQKAWFTADGRSIVAYASWDSVFRIVHLTPASGQIGGATQPVQAAWGPDSWLRPLPPGSILGSITGFVRDSAKRAITGADIAIFDGDKPGSTPIARTSTNAAGHFLLQGIKIPHVVVRATKRGFATNVRYAHFPAREAGVDFELKSDTSVGTPARDR